MRSPYSGQSRRCPDRPRLLHLLEKKPGLLWPLLTSRSGSCVRVVTLTPFRHEARSPQVRTHSFTAQPPDLRHVSLATRALRFMARSPCSATPSIRFLYIGSRFRSTLPSHDRSPVPSCASLRSLWPAHGGTCTHKSAPMLCAPKKNPPGEPSGLYSDYQPTRLAARPIRKPGCNARRRNDR